MHVLSGDDKPKLRHVFHRHPEARLRDRFRTIVMWIANRVANYRTLCSGPRVTLKRLEQGNVRMVLSVLYSPFSEIDLTQHYAAPPRSTYPSDLFEQMQSVKHDLETHPHHRDRLVIVRNAEELDVAERDNRVAFVHCVEGGFHLGATVDEVDATVVKLARRGVAYVTLAHLFWRQVATNVPAIPFLPDRVYDCLFPQNTELGLGRLGVAAVNAMYREHVVVDVSHMRAAALEETFDLLDRLDQDSGAAPTEHPVIASHAGVRRPGGQSYNLTRETVERIHARGGVVGLIMARHQLKDGLRWRRTGNFKQSFAVMCDHFDLLESWTGSHETAAIGTDLDGFIKPTVGGVQTPKDLVQLGPALEEKYGAATAELILWKNARRVVRHALQAR
jgi:microsomal dipeptidase-like Zn-dependent dipeptidase